jgi:hypothetical protein
VRGSLIVLLAIAALAAAPHRALTQDRPTAVLAGVVKDVDGKPIPDVVVDVSPGKRHAVTDDRGRFRFDRLPTDSLVMIVRRVGLVPLTFDMTLVPGQNDVNITMEQVPQILDAVRNQTEQTGLFGVVGDTAFDIVQGAAVSTVMHKDTKTTNEKGQFFFDPVKPGPDMVDVRKLGYRPRVVSYTMPVKGGQRVAIWLTPLPAGLDERAMRRLSAPSNALVQELFDIGLRRRWASSTRSMFATREQLALYARGMRLDEAIRYLPKFGTVRPYDIDCVIVDGSMASGFFDQYTADEIETLEVTAVGLLSEGERRSCTRNGSSGVAHRQEHWAALIMLRH